MLLDYVGLNPKDQISVSAPLLHSTAESSQCIFLTNPHNIVEINKIVLLNAWFNAVAIESDEEQKKEQESSEYVGNPCSSGEADKGLTAR